VNLLEAHKSTGYLSPTGKPTRSVRRTSGFVQVGLWELGKLSRNLPLLRLFRAADTDLQLLADRVRKRFRYSTTLKLLKTVPLGCDCNLRFQTQSPTKRAAGCAGGVLDRSAVGEPRFKILSHQLAAHSAANSSLLGNIVSGVFTPVLAKHSTKFSVVDSLAIGVDRIQRNFEPLRQQVETWRSRQLTDEQAKLLIYRAFVEGDLSVPRSLASDVHRNYFEPIHPEFAPRTMWSLSNAFTSALKSLDPIPFFQATAKLGTFLSGNN
jgi:hypothetical protein